MGAYQLMLSTDWSRSSSIERAENTYISFIINWYWFFMVSSLPHGSIIAWHHLEQKFHDHFYIGDNELKLPHFTSVKKNKDESVSDYVKRFRSTKNRCYSLVISERDLADLLLSGLKTYIKDRLEGYEFFNY